MILVIDTSNSAKVVESLSTPQDDFGAFDSLHRCDWKTCKYIESM